MAGIQRIIRIRVNGVPYERTVEVRKLLVDFLRQDLHLTGTHVGCEHGVCGACTVLLNGESVRSCLMFAVQVDGADLVTVEGLARDGELSVLQRAFWEHHGLQCGFCTPGFLTTARELIERTPLAIKEEIRETLAGNLCRCTGYQTIVEAVEDALAKSQQEASEKQSRS
ncbi:MAG: (2Fe-2S)-binding protein [Acidobacteria bacterium]|nr:MAG: (2Fe-2S)-binding protein [Acidobacteriota bacterium]HLB89068.1 (2Fe-2S)-binding protein [Terriglobales bacterium]